VIRSSPPRQRHGAVLRRLATTLLVAVAAAPAGCRSASSYDTRLPARAASTAGSGAVAVEASGGSGARAEILAGYRAYWHALEVAGATADAASPSLRAHATGLALSEAEAHFTSLRRLGEVDRGTVALHPRVVAVRGAAATVEDCPDTSGWLRRDASTGALREPVDAHSVKHRAVLFLIGSTWKVANITGKERCQS